MTNFNDDYQVQGNSGTTRMQSELTAAFNRVADKANWKNRIRMTVHVLDDADLSLLRDAVIHFTGSVPTFAALGRNLYRVEAAGYYLTIGA